MTKQIVTAPVNPDSVASAILEQHTRIRAMLEELDSLAKKAGAGEGDPTPLRARLLDLSVVLFGHFEQEETGLGALESAKCGSPALSLADLHREHEKQRKELGELASIALNHAVARATLVALTGQLLSDVRADMAHEERALSQLRSVSGSEPGSTA